MNKSVFAFGIISLVGAASAQTFTVSSTSGTGVTASGISLSSSSTSTLTSTGTWTLVGTTSVANPFDRFDVRVNSTRTTGSGFPSGADDPLSRTITPGFGTRTTQGLGLSSTSTDLNLGSIGNTYSITAVVNASGLTTSAVVGIAATQAPLVTQTTLGTSTASAGSATVNGSTASSFIFDFPSFPAGTATVNLTALSASASRALNGLGYASQHKDTVTLVREFWLGGTLLSSSSSSVSTFAPNSGTGAQSLNLAAGSVVINAGDVYATTKNFEVRTKLVGKAFFGGGSTQLGSDYVIGQTSTFGTIQGVPEPASIAGLSLGLLAFARRRKSK